MPIDKSHVPEDPTEAQAKELMIGTKPPGDTSFLYIRCAPKEKAAWVKAAKGHKLEAWVRATLNKASGYP